MREDISMRHSAKWLYADEQVREWKRANGRSGPLPRQELLALRRLFFGKYDTELTEADKGVWLARSRRNRANLQAISGSHRRPLRSLAQTSRGVVDSKSLWGIG